MLRSTPKLQDKSKWAIGLRREMQIAIGQQLRVIFQLPQEIEPELKTLASSIHKERTERSATLSVLVDTGLALAFSNIRDPSHTGGTATWNGNRKDVQLR
jgi:hypothetical protein